MECRGQKTIAASITEATVAPATDYPLKLSCLGSLPPGSGIALPAV